MMMVRTPVALLGVVALLGSTPARSQDFTGTWQVSGNGTAVTLTLRQARNGQITGTLQGNTTFQVKAQVTASGFAGFASNREGKLYLEGQHAGTGLLVAMAEVDANGQPQPQTARTVAMGRVAAGTGQAGARGAMANPAPGAPKAGSQGAVATSALDRQVAQLLLRSAWCSFSYSGVSGTSSGSSHSERVVFRADGTGARQTGGESYYSGSAGSVAGQSAGGEPFRWQMRGGLLNTSADGATWAQTRLQITTNSNGYPIITADGKEYSMCN